MADVEAGGSEDVRTGSADGAGAASVGTPAPRNRSGRNLPAAIGVGVGLFAAVVATLEWFHWGFVVMVAAALALGSIEVSRALKRVGMNAATVPIVVGAIAIVTGSYLAGSLPSAGIPSNTWLLVSTGLTVLTALIWRMPGGADGFVRDAAASLFIIAYVPLLGSFVPLLLASPQGGRQVVVYMLCVLASDIGGFVVGVLAGRHQMAPRISPKKTWEGFAGSIGFGMIIGVLGVTLLLGAPWWVGLMLGALLVAFGTAGDLVESLIKRDVGIKDMSHFLPGHGGVMDRLDSLLLAAPVAWLVLHVAVTLPAGVGR